MAKTNLLAISDLQEPFGHVDAFDFVCHVLKTFWTPAERAKVKIFNVGDEVDQHTIGRWPANPDGMSGGDELKEAILRLQPWFKKFPVTKVCWSNHTYRAWKKASEAGLPSAFMRTVKEVYQAPKGWEWAQEWYIDDIMLEHGENVSGQTAALKAALDNRRKTIIGHQHTNGGVIHSGAKSHADIWGLNTGCLIDIEKYAFSYGKAYRNKPTLGCGVVVNGIPYFVPMILNTRRRWVGYL